MNGPRMEHEDIEPGAMREELGGAMMSQDEHRGAMGSQEKP